MKTAFYDLETYYDPAAKYDLKSRGSLGYIYDAQFELVCGTVIIDDQHYQAWGHQQTIDLLRTHLTGNYAVAHNGIEFDHLILGRFGIRPAMYGDTLAMARACGVSDSVGGSLAALAKHFGLPDKGKEVVMAVGKRGADFRGAEKNAYLGYCDHDTVLCQEIFKRLMQEPAMTAQKCMELHAISMTAKTNVEVYFEIDTALVAKTITEETERRETLAEELAAWGVEITGVLDKQGNMQYPQIGSNQQFAELLSDLGAEPPMKISPTTGLETFAFDKKTPEFMALLEHDNAAVAALVGARLGLKTNIIKSRAEKFHDTAMLTDGRMYSGLRYFGAFATGRFSTWGGNNLLNIPARAKTQKVLKKALRAKPGHVLIGADSAQVEMRQGAWLAGERGMLEVFRRDEDIYKQFGAQMFNTYYDEVTKAQRQIAKSGCLGCLFGAGYDGFLTYARAMGEKEMTPELAQRVVDTYRNTYPHIRNAWDSAGGVLKAMLSGYTGAIPGVRGVSVATGGRVMLPSGRELFYPNLRVEAGANGKPSIVYDRRRGRAVIKEYIYGGKLYQNCTQAAARDAIVWQALRFAKEVGDAAEINLILHDAIYCTVPSPHTEEVAAVLKKWMSTSPPWATDMPLACQYDIGETMADV
jgi:DNA polymerase I-like protein with 3'-5' exonuclease and polymerase domains